jgi:YVTN family beta-propeller protein
MTSFTRRAFVTTMVTAPVAGALASRTAAAQTPAASAAGQVIVLSNSSPHVSVIDPESLAIVATKEFPDFPGWTWNDDYNFYDGRSLWLGTRSMETNDSSVISLDLDTLEITAEIPTGKEEMTLYLSRGGKDGRFYVGKMGGAQVLAIDPVSATIAETWDVPVNGGVVCDIDVYTGDDGVGRVYYPTYQGNTVAIVNPVNGEVSPVSSDFPEGAGPWMSTVGPDGRLWVQWEANTNDVLDGTDLSLVERIPVGKLPTNATFSPDGKYAYISHYGDTLIIVVEIATFEKVAEIQVGTNAIQVAVNPDGATIYAIANEDGLVAVIDTASWEVTDRINLGTNPGTIYFRSPAS